jgi:hypothetical protein
MDDMKTIINKEDQGLQKLSKTFRACLLVANTDNSLTQTVEFQNTSG